MTWGDTGGQWTPVLGDCQGPTQRKRHVPCHSEIPGRMLVECDTASCGVDG